MKIKTVKSAVLVCSTMRSDIRRIRRKLVLSRLSATIRMAARAVDYATRSSNGNVPASAMTEVIGLATIAPEANRTILFYAGAKICRDAGPSRLTSSIL